MVLTTNRFLAMVRTVLGAPNGTGICQQFQSKDYGGLEWLHWSRGKEELIIPGGCGKVSTLVPYRGGRGTFHYVSATDVLA